MPAPDLLPFAQYLDLFDRHERAAVEALGRVGPDATVGVDGSDAVNHAREHLATLEVWAWLLEHPESGWQAYPGGPLRPDLADVLNAIAEARDRLTRLLVDAGPELALDYFGRPGTSLDVARLLAHEAIDVAYAAQRAGGVPTDPLHPDVAADCVGRALEHWARPDADIDWSPEPAHLIATDTGRSWWVRFGDHRDGYGDIAPGASGLASLEVRGTADALLRWLQGYPVTSLEVEGGEPAFRKLRVALGHRVEPPRRRGWWRRRQS